MESLEVDGVEGDDHFFIRSTRAGAVTTIDGGNGNDTFDVAGDVTVPIVSKDLEGLSGVVDHQVTSGDTNYSGLLAPGISLNVADATTGQFVLGQSAGSTIVNEQGVSTDYYAVRLAAAPTGTVYVNVSAEAAPPRRRKTLGGD